MIIQWVEDSIREESKQEVVVAEATPVTEKPKRKYNRKTKATEEPTEE